MDRTVVLQLHPTSEQAHTLQETLQQHTACFNAVASLGFAQKCRNGVELHKQTYYDLRARYPELPAQLVCAARVKATEAVKSALDRLYKGRKTSAPHSRVTPIRYDQRSYWVKWVTPVKPVRGVAIRRALIVVLKVSSSVELAAIVSPQT